jgi:hypothetical protein
MQDVFLSEDHGFLAKPLNLICREHDIKLEERIDERERIVEL